MFNVYLPQFFSRACYEKHTTIFLALDTISIFKFTNIAKYLNLRHKHTLNNHTRTHTHTRTESQTHIAFITQTNTKK